MVDRKKVIILFYSVAFGFAFITSLLGPVLNQVLEEFGLLYAQGGALFSASSIGFMGGSFLGGLVTDRFSRRGLLLAALTMLLVSAAGGAFAPNYRVLAAAVAAGGLAGGTLITIVSGGIGDLYTEKRAAALNLLNVFVGLGGIISPLYISGVLLLGNNWRSVFGFTAIPVCLLIAITCFTRLPQPAASSRGGQPRVSYFALLRDPRTFIFVTSVLLAGGVEWGFANWAVTYMTDLGGLSAPLAANVLSLFWAGMLVGRLAMSRVLASFDAVRVLQLITLGACIIITAVSLTTTLPLLVLGIALFGLLVAGLTPTLMGLMMDYNPEYSGSVSGLLMLASGFGSLLVPQAIGFIADAVGLAWGMRLVAILLALLWLLVSLHRRSNIVVLTPQVDR
ncbi:MAG: MFS transporter [Chloroflexota bacterium]|nr:MFS transporter [Chloroflexota bacterium]